jgi:hypothetical protein
MPREIEKQLLKELEQALVDRDRAESRQMDAAKSANEATSKMNAARVEADALTTAIASLRKSPLLPETKQKIEQEARENMKEKPVA